MNKKPFEKQENTQTICLGNGVWDFSTFFSRPEKEQEQQRNSKLNLEDKFTRSFLLLHQVLKRNQEKKEEQNTLPYYLLHMEEKQGIFLLKNNPVSLTEAPFHLTGAEAMDQQRNYLHGYTRELRKYLTQTFQIIFKPLNKYYGSAVLSDDKNNKCGKVSMGVSMNLENFLHAVIFPLEEANNLQRVVYQVAFPDKEKVLGAGFFYFDKKKEYERYEVKELSLK